MERLMAELKKNKKVVAYIVLFVLAFLLAAIFLPSWISGAFLSNNIEESKDIRSFLLKAAGGIIALLALYLNYRRTNATEKKNSIDESTANNNLLIQQYAKASELLASDNISSRLSGIYLFEKIMNNNKEYYWQVIELLSAYVREKRNIQNYWIKEEEIDLYENFDQIKVASEEPKPTNFNSKNTYFKIEKVEADIQAIITVLGRRHLDYHKEDHHINLRNTNLYGANFREDAIRNEKSNLRFVGFNLVNVILFDCIFSDSYFENSYFQEAYIKDTKIIRSHFKNCCFTWSTFIYNEFDKPNFESSSFINSYIAHAKGLTVEDLGTAKSFIKNFFLDQRLKEALEKKYPEKILSKNWP